MIVLALISLVAAYVYGHVFEYCAHRLLHKLGYRGSPLAFHLQEHHIQARSDLMNDRPSFRESLGVLAIMALHVPLYSIVPWFVLGIALSCVSYLYHHWRAHLDVLWAIRYLPWHVEHHMRNQRANWGVRSNWVDQIAGTVDWQIPSNRITYVGRKNRALALWIRVCGGRNWTNDDYERRNVPRSPRR